MYSVREVTAESVMQYTGFIPAALTDKVFVVLDGDDVAVDGRGCYEIYTTAAAAERALRGLRLPVVAEGAVR